MIKEVSIYYQFGCLELRDKYILHLNHQLILTDIFFSSSLYAIFSQTPFKNTKQIKVMAATDDVASKGSGVLKKMFLSRTACA